MNACIRAVVRKSLQQGLKVVGIRRGFEGMIEGDFLSLDSDSVSNIIQRGGTTLKSARSIEFMTIEGRKKAFDHLKAHNIDALIAIGGDGTFTGARIFEQEFGIPVIGVPGTIDNDLFGTDATIGYDTALNTVVSAVDKIRDTAESHNRLFFIEVMGRDAGFIALRSGIASGAESVLVPEMITHIEDLVKMLETRQLRKQNSAIIMVAEGDDAGGAFQVAEKVKARFDYYETRVTVLGHLQRGGNPSAYDRVLASQLGVASVDALLSGQSMLMVGMQGRDIAFTPFEQAIKHHKELNKGLLSLLEVLA